MDKKELETTLEQHALWLEDTSQGARADLRDADLRDADLSCAYLSDADLRFADLRGASLRGAYLSDASLSCANLSGANLDGANLRCADLSGANLRNANLRGTNLSGTDLDGVLYSVNTCFFALQCPEEGAFIGWKKCRNRVIVKLLIPEDAKRSSATTRKCRASKVQVLEVIGGDFGESGYDGSVVYRKGDTIVVNDFDDDRWRECSAGIHFFLTRGEAESYEL